MSYWGYHLMLDCSGCNDNIKQKQSIYDFIKELVANIDMTPYGEPIIELLLPGELNQGYSLMQLITTSNICAHFVDNNNSAYIDVFSCKPFDIETVKQVVSKYFSPNKMKLNFITRHAE